MFENTSKTPNRIIKLDGKNRFVEISQAFGIGKIKFAFRVYNENNPKGSRILQQIDCYMDIDDAVDFANQCTNQLIFKYAKANEKARAAGNYAFAKPCFESFSGTKKGGPDKDKVIARRLQIIRKNPDDQYAKKMPYTMRVLETPGNVTNTGAITPVQNAPKEESQYIAIGLTGPDIIRIGLQITRACNIYDIWVANGTLQENLNRIHENTPGMGSKHQSDRNYSSRQQYTNYPDPYAAGNQQRVYQ